VGAKAADHDKAMSSVRLVRGEATRDDLSQALDRLGVHHGESFVVMSVRHRDELNDNAWRKHG
jgi:hypothetical protein